MSQPQGPHQRIVVSLPDIQDQIRMVNRLHAAANEPEQGRLSTLGLFLCQLYTQLQHQRQVTLYRPGLKSSTSASRRKTAAKK
jgi:hypothetical protein